MTNRCNGCGKCCLDTEMILSKKDIINILKNFPEISKESQFYFINRDGFFQLLNINHHCFFFDPNSKVCKIYNIRPQGCRFYPLIYNPEKQCCHFDEDCPRTELFYQTKQEFQKTCQLIKKFLKTQLHLEI